MSSREYRWLWLWVLVLLAGMELTALLRKARGDTLSEYVWAKTHAAPFRVTLGALLVWLVYHFLFPTPTRSLTRWDLVFATLGALVGLLSYFWHR